MEDFDTTFHFVEQPYKSGTIKSSKTCHFVMTF